MVSNKINQNIPLVSQEERNNVSGLGFSSLFSIPLIAYGICQTHYSYNGTLSMNFYAACVTTKPDQNFPLTHAAMIY